MTWVDYVVAGIIVASVLWGVWRGLVREILSILAWIIAFLTAGLFAGPLAARIPASLIDTPAIRLFAAYAALFIGALFATALVALLVSRLVHAAGLSTLDRALGALFGVARGVLLVVALVLLAGLTSLPHQAAWRESASGGPLSAFARALKGWLPQSFAERLSYD